MTGYCETAQEVLEDLGCDPRRGLDGAEAARRLERHGPNSLDAGKRPSLLRRVFGQLKDPMILVLLAAAGLSWWAGGGRDWLDSGIILLIVVVNAVLSITQEDHAQKALDALRDMAAPTALVRRDGALCRVEARDLVPGDLVYIEGATRPRRTGGCCPPPACGWTRVP